MPKSATSPKRVSVATPSRHTRVCPVCGATFAIRKPSQVQRCCSHRCAWTEIGDTVRAAAYTPEARAKVRDAVRARGDGKDGYLRRDGKHVHRTVVENRIGRTLRSDEIVHHRDENKRNNADTNLEVMTRAEHARVHHCASKLVPIIKRRK